MMFQKCRLVAILFLQSGFLDVRAFTNSASMECHTNYGQLYSQGKLLHLPPTCLRMSEEETTQDETEDGKPNASAGDATNDILSSPAFLKRKVEVLQSDIASTEEDLAKSIERLEIAKEEWLPQLEALQLEVRTCVHFVNEFLFSFASFLFFWFVDGCRNRGFEEKLDHAHVSSLVFQYSRKDVESKPRW